LASGVSRKSTPAAPLAILESGWIGMGWLRTLGSIDYSRSVDQDLVRLWGWLKAHVGLLIVVAGAFLRLLVYARNHNFCMDEGFLWGSIADLPAFQFSSELSQDQLAPFGFLIVERLLIGLFGATTYVARFVPLLSGLTALALFLPLALKVAPRRAALVGLTLFAFSDDQIFYSNEMKQYSLELAIAIALGLATLHAIERPFSWRIAGPLALLAIASPWFSFSAVFIVASCGLALVFSSITRRRWLAAAFWCAIGVAWGVSFAAAYKASLALLSTHTTMYVFWKFAFLPIWPFPPSVLRSYETIGILLEVFANPLNMVHPLWIGVFLPLLTLLAGAYSLARRSWPAWVVLVMPIVLAMLASALNRYPFHGRLILELVPAIFLLMALGLECFAAKVPGSSQAAYKVLLVVLIGYPCLAALNQAVFRPVRDGNRHGDLHTNLFIRYEYIMPSQLRDQ